MTTPLWGVGSTAPYGHDGRSINLREAERSRGFRRMEDEERDALLAFLESLVIFPPDDTASTLDPGARGAANFPQHGHGSIKLAVLFNNPNDIE